MIYKTVEELREACKFWQEILSLEDWQVVIRFARVYEIGEDSQGRCNWVLERKEAVILILDHQDWDPDCAFEQDHERTIIHELCHLHFAPFFGEETPDHKIEKEQAIHAVSRALIRIKVVRRL